MGLYCGIDWATDHHDIAVVDQDGRTVAGGRVENTASGFAALLAMLADAGEDPHTPMPVAIETDHGLWVAALTASGRQVYPINPLAASRYRSQPFVSGAKSDAVDARTLAKILTSFPGVGPVVGARVLAEIGDDRTKFDDARGLKAFAGSAPITRASGKKTVITHRHIKNRRLAAAGSIWAMASLKSSPGARRHYDARRAKGDWLQEAKRHLFNKFLGQLHHCLQTGQTYNETHAFPPPLTLAA